MKVLVVGENRGSRRAIRACLHGRDYRVETVAGGREAIARAGRDTFDLIVVDLAPADSSSLLVLHELRELNRESEILVLTTAGQIGVRITALIQGADDYLVKPLRCDDLIARIRAAGKRRGSFDR